MQQAIDQLLRRTPIREIALRRPACVDPTTPLSEACRLLEERHLRSVLVCEEGRLVGIFTERDVLYRIALEEIDPATPIRDLMVADPASLDPDQTLAEAVAAMLDGGYRQLPMVAGDGRPLGLLSSRALFAFIADQVPEAIVNLPPRLHQRLARPEGG